MLSQTILDDLDRRMGDVDSDPFSTKLLGGMNSRSAAAKRVKDDLTSTG